MMEKWKDAIYVFELELIFKNVISIFKENCCIAMYYVYHKLKCKVDMLKVSMEWKSLTKQIENKIFHHLRDICALL